MRLFCVLYCPYMPNEDWEVGMGLTGGPDPIDDTLEEPPKPENDEAGIPPKDERPGVND